MTEQTTLVELSEVTTHGADAYHALLLLPPKFVPTIVTDVVVDVGEDVVTELMRGVFAWR